MFMDTSNVIATPVTHVSGAVTIGSVGASKVAESVASSSTSFEAMEKAGQVMVTADMLALCSFVVMILTFVWNIYLGYRRDKRDEERQNEWRKNKDGH